jgi:DNA-binding CsgD family transcriptional regulator/DNA polymerase III delta prime subunit
VASTSGRTAFVGRERELALLRERLAAAGAGDAGAVLIGGEPGVGKTRLALELTREACGTGWQILAGRAYETEGMPPYLPLVEALSGVPTVRGTASAGLSRLFAAAGRRSGSMSDYHRHRLFQAVVESLVASARGGDAGVLLWLDDLHWADEPSLLLIRHLLRRLPSQPAPLLVIGTHRTVDAGRGGAFDGLLADVRREGLAETITLRPFSLEETRRLVEAIGAARAQGGLVAALHRETGGNAFYLTEFIRDLRDRYAELGGLADLPAGRPLPRGVRQVIGARVARLRPHAVRLLQAATVCGDGADARLLGAVAGVQGTALLDGLDEALAAGMLRDEDGRWHVAHALIAEAVTDGLNSARRAALHGAALAALEERAGHDPSALLGELAHHALRAGLDQSDPRPYRYARRAADHAVASLAFEEAVRLFELALSALRSHETSDADRERLETLLALADARRRSGRFRAAMETFAAAFPQARMVGDAEAMARAAGGYEDALLADGGPRSPADASIRMQEEALCALEPEDSAARVRLLAGLARALFFSGDRTRPPSLVDQALAIARRLGDDVALVAALHAKRIIIWGPDRLPERLSVATELMTLARRVDDVELELEGWQWRLFALLEAGRAATFDAELAGYAALAREVAQPLFIFKAETWRHARALMAGRYDEVEGFIEEALGVARHTEATSIAADASLLLFHLRVAQGRCAEVVEVFRGFADRHPELPVWRFVLNVVLAEAGRTPEARALSEHLAAAGYGDVPDDYFRLMIHVFAAEVCVRLGEREHAALLYERLLPYRDQAAVVLPNHLGSTAGHLGALAALLGRWDDAEAHFQAAESADRHAGARARLAQTLTQHARLLLDRPDHRRTNRRRARALLDEALDLYDAFGPVYGRRARQLLDDPRLAASPRPVFPDRLTEREVEVLRLLADGRSNREIADTLVLSERTIERHVAKMYAKIGAHTRAEATRYAVRRGLVS